MVHTPIFTRLPTFGYSSEEKKVVQENFKQIFVRNYEVANNESMVTVQSFQSSRRFYILKKYLLHLGSLPKNYLFQ